jgi:hypothetical protein
METVCDGLQVLSRMLGHFVVEDIHTQQEVDDQISINPQTQSGM